MNHEDLGVFHALPVPIFDYTYTRALCQQEGLVFDEPTALKADQEFARLNLTQAQVDGVMRVHILTVKNRLFNPKTYPVIGRLALAWHFLFGKEPKSGD